MANDCSNTLQIHCDNKQLLEKIHNLFIQEVSGVTQYTMMKLIPIPAEKYDSDRNPLVGFFTPMGYWGTRSDFWWPEAEWRKDEFNFEYYTANGPNKYWIHDLLSAITNMVNEYSGETKPKIFVKHLYDICQVQFAGFLYWEPGMKMKYEYSTEDNLNEKVENEFKIFGEADRIKREVDDFLTEYDNPSELIEQEFILPGEMINEMKTEFQLNTADHNSPFNDFHMYCQRVIEYMSQVFNPWEILALFRHSYKFYCNKDWKNLKEKVIEEIDNSDLRNYEIDDPSDFLKKIREVNTNAFFEIIHVLCESITVMKCHEWNIPMVTEREELGIWADDFISTDFEPPIDVAQKNNCI